MILATIVLSLIFSIPLMASDSTGIMTATQSLNPETISCVQNAIEARDTAISGAVDAYAISVKMALGTRKDGLKAGWAKGKPADIRAALKVAWSTYTKTLRDAKKTLKDAKTKAWNTFKTQRKACKGGENLEGSNPQVDNTL